MKKLIFSLFVLPLVVLFASCNLNPKPYEDDTSRGGNDIVDGDTGKELKKYVTLRLADSGEFVSGSIGIGIGNTVLDSRSESRRLTYDNAVASHDFFEAVFYYSDSGNTTIARTAWNIGETPELRGVFRTPAPGGINYGFVSYSSIPSGNRATSGAAVLFVGAKEENGNTTLLALGRLVEVDGTTGTTITADERNPAGDLIRQGTTSVTFEVAAIKAGVNKTDGGSFRTYRALGGDTIPNLSTDVTDIDNDIYVHYVDKKYFPLFKLGGPSTNNVTHGVYTFEIDATPDFNQYADGIVLAGERHYESRNPRYPITNGLYQYSSFLVQDLSMRDRGHLGMMNNPLVNTDTFFQNPVVFKIDTSATQDGSVFALVFEIFVYNLTSAPSSLINGVPSLFPEPVKWRISPGYGTYWLDLDDGLNGTGGAIFMGTGDVGANLPNFPFTPPVANPYP